MKSLRQSIARCYVWVFMIPVGFCLILMTPIVYIIRLCRKRQGAKVYSLWGGEPIINKITQAKAERLLGVEAKTLVFGTYFITKGFDYDLSQLIPNPYILFLLRPFVFLWACLRFHRFHFFCGEGLLPPVRARRFNPVELWGYRLLKKEIFFWTYGSDVRTRQLTLALGEPNCCTECPEPGKYCVCNDSWGQNNQERLQNYGCATFSMGDMTEYTPGSRNGLFFWPVDLKDEKYWPVFPDPLEKGPVRVVHAPNHRYFKGTNFLEKAVSQLQKEGLSVELLLVEHVPNETALTIYRTADIIFDQCLIGFHGYLAIEAMAMGKPVMAYIKKPDEYLLCPEECPIIWDAPADRVESVLRELIGNRQHLNQLGIQGRHYVEKYFTIEAFSERLRQAYNDLGER